MSVVKYQIQPIAALEEGSQFYLYDHDEGVSRLWRLVAHKTAYLSIVQPVGFQPLCEVKSKILVTPVNRHKE